MMNRWLDRGIAGFRMDVIDLIGKDIDNGVLEQGPDLHSYLQELHRETLAGRDVVTVGEAWSVTPDTALDFCADERAELDMVFHFKDHPDVLAYARDHARQRLVVIANFTGHAVSVAIDRDYRIGGECIAIHRSPHRVVPETLKLQPYEVLAVLASTAARDASP